MEVKEKIEKIMEKEQMNSLQFASEIGIQGSTLSHILNDRNKPSLDVLKKILNRFRTISSDWLILDVGSMYRQEKQSQAPTL
ncbi:MAG: helix-turn-helix transcriptional regulator, partial [Paludibacter sp.]